MFLRLSLLGLFLLNGRTSGEEEVPPPSDVEVEDDVDLMEGVELETEMDEDEELGGLGDKLLNTLSKEEIEEKLNTVDDEWSQEQRKESMSLCVALVRSKLETLDPVMSSTVQQLMTLQNLGAEEAQQAISMHMLASCYSNADEEAREVFRGGRQEFVENTELSEKLLGPHKVATENKIWPQFTERQSEKGIRLVPSEVLNTVISKERAEVQRDNDTGLPGASEREIWAGARQECRGVLMSTLTKTLFAFLVFGGFFGSLILVLKKVASVDSSKPVKEKSKKSQLAAAKLAARESKKLR